MILNDLKSPIQFVDLHEINIDISQLAEKLQYAYDKDYEWDHYLHRQSKISHLKKHIAPKDLENISNTLWRRYYQGELDDAYLLDSIDESFLTIKSDFRKIKPSRKRLISTYHLKLDSQNWAITRVPTGMFKQPNGALKNTECNASYKKTARKFKELPEHLDDADLHKILRFIAHNLQKNLTPPPKKLNITVHHTLIFCYPNASGSNAPEGIHQDGTDFIISALVIERKNITGGTSIIYGSDAETEITNATLHAGQGILQPDKDSDLWHSVTPIECERKKEKGYRSTIGFDITVAG